MDKKKKIVLIISLIVVGFILVIGGTVAFFGWQAEKESIVSVTVSSGVGSCSNKSDNNVLLVPTSTREKGRIIKLNAKQEMANKAYITWKLVVNKIEGLQDESFKYELVNSSNGYSYGSGNFKDIEAGDTITFSNNEEALGYNLNYEFTLYLWIDGSSFNNPIAMSNQTFDFDITCSITGTDNGTVVEPKKTLVEHITNLYNENVDEENPVTNNGIAYNYARIYAEDGSTSGGLMNDRHDNAGNLLDDANAGNIRYYGASPNNYINFNCETYPDTNCETWRIIGVFDGKVKLIRNSVLGKYSWDYKYDGSTTSYSNDWSKATLNTLLNDTYYKVGSTNYYNNSKTPTTVNFSSTGLKNDTTRNMISETLYYLGGWTSSSVYSDQIYEYERGTNKCSNCTYETRWPGKIALAYPSDYGYAADFGSCGQTLSGYNNSSCITVNWMKSILGTSSNGWLLTSYSGDSSTAWNVFSSCYVGSNLYVNNVNGVAPVLHLNSDVVIESGDGSSGNPYRISVG